MVNAMGHNVNNGEAACAVMSARWAEQCCGGAAERALMSAHRYKL